MATTIPDLNSMESFTQSYINSLIKAKTLDDDIKPGIAADYLRTAFYSNVIKTIFSSSKTNKASRYAKLIRFLSKKTVLPPNLAGVSTIWGDVSTKLGQIQLHDPVATLHGLLTLLCCSFTHVHEEYEMAQELQNLMTELYTQKDAMLQNWPHVISSLETDVASRIREVVLRKAEYLRTRFHRVIQGIRCPPPSLKLLDTLDQAHERINVGVMANAFLQPMNQLDPNVEAYMACIRLLMNRPQAIDGNTLLEFDRARITYLNLSLPQAKVILDHSN